MKKEKKTRTDLEALAAMTDDDIDCSDIEMFTEEWLKSAEWLVEQPEKEMISIRLDRPTLEFYRSFGKGYQKRINAVLRAFAETTEKRRMTKKV